MKSLRHGKATPNNNRKIAGTEWDLAACVS
jgi:hypothetical protein